LIKQVTSGTINGTGIRGKQNREWLDIGEEVNETENGLILEKR